MPRNFLTPNSATMKQKPTLMHSTVVNFCGLVVPIIVALLTVPLYLHLLGEIRYGVLLLAISLLGYFGAFDFGLGKAVTHRLAGQEEVSVRNDIFWTALIVSSLIGIVGGILLYVLGILFSDLFHIPPAIYTETIAALPWLAAIVPLISVISVLGGALQARHAFIAFNIGQATGFVCAQLFPLLAVIFVSKSIPVLIAASLIGRFSGVLPMLWSNARILPLEGRPRICQREIVPLLRFGGWVSGSNFIVPMLTIVDRLVIGAKLGMVAVTAYTIPFNFTQRFTYLPFSLSTSLFPRFSQEEGEHAMLLMRRSITVLAALQTPVIVAAILLIYPFFNLWIGPDLTEKAGPVAIILLVSIWINGPAFVPVTYMPAMGRPDLMTKFYLAELFPFLLLLWFLVGHFGILGAAIAWLIRSAADAMFCFIMTSTFDSYWRTMGIMSPLLVIAILVAFVPIPLTFSIIAACIIFLASVLLSFYKLPWDIRRKILGKITKITAGEIDEHYV